MEDNLNRRLLGNHKDFNKGCSRKIRVPCGNFPSHFRVLLAVMDLPGIISHCVILPRRSHKGKLRRGWWNMSKNISRLHNHVLTGHSKDFNSLLVILYLRNIYQPENTSELSTDDGSIKRRKTNEINFGGRFPYYLLLCHPYGYNHLKQR